MTNSIGQGKPTTNILAGLKEEKLVKSPTKSSSEGEEERSESESESGEDEESEEEEVVPKVSKPKIDIKNMNSKNESQMSSKGKLSKGVLDDRRESESRHAFESHSNREAKQNEKNTEKKQSGSTAIPNISSAKNPIKTFTAATTKNANKPALTITKPVQKAVDSKKPGPKKPVMTYADPKGFDMADDILSKLRAEFIDKEPEEPKFDFDVDMPNDQDDVNALEIDPAFENESQEKNNEDSEHVKSDPDEEEIVMKPIEEIPSKAKAVPKSTASLQKETSNSKNIKKQMKSAKKDQIISPLKGLLSETRKQSSQTKPDSRISGESKSRLEILREQKRASQIKGKN